MDGVGSRAAASVTLVDSPRLQLAHLATRRWRGTALSLNVSTSLRDGQGVLLSRLVVPSPSLLQTRVLCWFG